MPQVQSPAHEFLKLIKEKIPGKKMVTVTCDEGSNIFDISEDGKVGYKKDHELLFLCKIARGLNEGAGLMIRQFLPLKVEITTANGKRMYVPTKNLYGFYLNDNTWIGLPKEHVRDCCNTDANTGKPLPEEKEVFYRDPPF